MNKIVAVTLFLGLIVGGTGCASTGNEYYDVRLQGIVGKSETKAREAEQTVAFIRNNTEEIANNQQRTETVVDSIGRR